MHPIPEIYKDVKCKKYICFRGTVDEHIFIFDNYIKYGYRDMPFDHFVALPFKVPIFHPEHMFNISVSRSSYDTICMYNGKQIFLYSEATGPIEFRKPKDLKYFVGFGDELVCNYHTVFAEFSYINKDNYLIDVSILNTYCAPGSKRFIKLPPGYEYFKIITGKLNETVNGNCINYTEDEFDFSIIIKNKVPFIISNGKIKNIKDVDEYLIFTTNHNKLYYYNSRSQMLINAPSMNSSDDN